MVDTSTTLTIVGIVLSVITTIGLFFLSGIKKSQEDLNHEVKEMNKDIRDVLIQIGKNDQQILNTNNRIDNILHVLNQLADRILKLEQVEKYQS